MDDVDDKGGVVPFERYAGALNRKQSAQTDAEVAVASLKPADGFSRRKNRVEIAPSLENAMHAIKKLGIKFRYDSFRGKVTFEGYVPQAGETLDDIELHLRDLITREFGFDPEPTHTRHAIRLMAMQNAFDPVREYLDGLKWDGTPRLDTWLRDFLGAPDDALTSAIGRAVLIAGVRRVRKPGCKFDSAMVLEGPQGSGKSTAIKILAGEEDLFTDEIVIGESYKEQQELLRGKWIAELPEMAGLHAAEVRRVKSFITKTHDRARPAFARSLEELPRRCILIGTTNDSDYLQDPTGNRRFWPVVTGKIDLAGLRAARDQLWAEAAAAEPEAADPISLPHALWSVAADRQAERVAADPWQDVLAAGLPGVTTEVDGEWRVTTQDVIERVMGMDVRHVSMRETKRLGECLRRLGWQGKAVRVGGAVLRGYAKKAEGGDG